MSDRKPSSGEEIYSLIQRLWPICRSITGPGVRETLNIIKQKIPELLIHEVPTGTACFDWVVPKEWSVRDAYILTPEGKKIADFQINNLHLVSYSIPIEMEVDLATLESHLHSLPDQPDAIPYVTSYYKPDWGFCLPHNVRARLKPGRYHVKIDSTLSDGYLTYGSVTLPGRERQEIFLSTYICHPSLANNELSGPCVTAQIAEWLQTIDRRYTYRIIFIPETIGAILYLSRHLEDLKKNVIAGYVITCVGDDRTWSFMPSRKGNTLSDAVARHVLQHIAPDFKEYSFLERGSDERQYCSPGVDLPVASIMRSKYATYPEYHTSFDNLDFVSPQGLEKSFIAYTRAIETIESNCTPHTRVLGEPMMSKRGLRATTGKFGSASSTVSMMNLLAYSDGRNSMIDIANIIGIPAWELSLIARKLQAENLLAMEGI
ncbi:MAG: DUF4910 domain-containing protein [Burkholderiales bacterium]|nr:DUF4910 domain-containing protein [Burkholderiales bacterium]